MEPVNILDARNRLSQLVSAASAGEDVVIAKRGRPVVRLIAVQDDSQHTGTELVRWLEANKVPRDSTRTPDELDAQIAHERFGWD